MKTTARLIEVVRQRKSTQSTHCVQALARHLGFTLYQTRPGYWSIHEPKWRPPHEKLTFHEEFVPIGKALPQEVKLVQDFNSEEGAEHIKEQDKVLSERGSAPATAHPKVKRALRDYLAKHWKRFYHIATITIKDPELRPDPNSPPDDPKDWTRRDIIRTLSMLD